MKQKLMYRYGRTVNTHDLVKVLATVVMVVDHIGLYFMDNNDWFRIVGRLAAPLFFMLVGASGAYHQKNELIIYAGVLMVFQFALTGFDPLFNILVNFMIIKFVLQRVDFASYNDIALSLFLVFLLISNVFLFDILEYGSLGLAFAIGPVLARKGHGFANTWLVSVILIYGLMNYTVYDETQYHQILVAIIFGIMLLICKFYSFRKLQIRSRLILAVSRYSLPIYVWHLTLFRFIFVAI